MEKSKFCVFKVCKEATASGVCALMWIDVHAKDSNTLTKQVGGTALAGDIHDCCCEPSHLTDFMSPVQAAEVWQILAVSLKEEANH